MTSAARARRIAGLTVTEVARRAAVHPSTVLRAERQGCGLALATRLAAIVGIPVDTYLVGRESARSGRRGRSLRPATQFQRGDRVRVLAGQFIGEFGTVEKPPDERPDAGMVGVQLDSPNARFGTFTPDALELI